MVFVFGVNPPRLVRLFLFFFRLHLDSFIFYAFFIHLGGFTLLNVSAATAFAFVGRDR